MNVGLQLIIQIFAMIPGQLRTAASQRHYWSELSSGSWNVVWEVLLTSSSGLLGLLEGVSVVRQS